MLKGRQKILTDFIPNGDLSHDLKIIPKILQQTISKHNENKTDIEQLKNYFYNDDIAIRNKTKTQQSEINNKIGVPYANIAVTTINSYCFSNPFTFASRSSNTSVQNMIKQLNDALDDDNYAQKTLNTEMNSGICGIGYKYIRPANKLELANGKWFSTSSELDSEKTYCIYANDLQKTKVMAVTFYDYNKYDSEGNLLNTITRYNCWTKYHYWIFDLENSDYKLVKQKFDNNDIIAYPLVYNRIPIIEYPRKYDRTSDFEIAIDLINANNNLVSSRVDDIQQATDYILLLRDICADTDEDIDKIVKGAKKHILSFKSIPNAIVQPEIKVLNTSQNQSQIQTLQDYLGQKIEESLNIPNRETRGSSGDSGSAVENRAGYRSLENIAGLVTSSAKTAENEALDVILSICKTFANCPFNQLNVKDIEIKDNRNKIENLTISANAYATLRGANMNDITALQVTNLVPDAISVADANKKELSVDNSNDTQNTNNSTQINNGTNSGNTDV